MKKWECTVCGYIHEGEEPPDECPVCSADKSMFVEVVEEAAPGESPTGQAAESKPAPKVQATFLLKAYTLASEQIVKHHLHPIMVHTPNGILPMALVFLLITAFFGLPLFETAALYSFVFVLISMPLVLFTGYEVWQKRYRGAMTPIFKVKICCFDCDRHSSFYPYHLASCATRYHDNSLQWTVGISLPLPCLGGSGRWSWSYGREIGLWQSEKLKGFW